MKADMMMAIRFQRWFLGVGLIGMAAGLAGAWLLWLLVTQPVAIAQALAGGL